MVSLNVGDTIIAVMPNGGKSKPMSIFKIDDTFCECVYLNLADECISVTLPLKWIMPVTIDDDKENPLPSTFSSI